MKLSGRIIFLLVAVSVTAVSFAYFGPFLDNFFTYDDFGAIEHVQEGPKAVLLGYNYILRFVGSTVWWPLYALSGHDPFGYNLFSLLLWLINAVLLYRLLRRLLGDDYLAAFGSLVFASTSIGADALFWRAANNTLLNVTFYLLALHAYVVFRQTDNRRQWHLSVFFFVLAVFTKEESASLPFVILLLELLYFDGRSDMKGVVRRLLVFSSFIIFYLVMNYLVIYYLFEAQSELVKQSRFRPLHSLLSGWTVFFLTPDGRLAMNDIRIYATAALLPMALFFTRDRRLLLLGLGWVFFTFLPQSLCNLSQFEPRHIFSSLSRHLYIPSIGAAMVYAAILSGVRDRFSPKVAVLAAVLFLACYLPYNYRLAQSRGMEWRADGEPVKLFLTEIRKVVPQFPPNTFVYVNDPPTGRAYVQQSMRAFYRTSEITWIVDPLKFMPKPGQNAFFIDCLWLPDGHIRFNIQRIY